MPHLHIKSQTCENSSEKQSLLIAFSILLTHTSYCISADLDGSILLHCPSHTLPFFSSSLYLSLRKWFVCRLRLAGALYCALGKPKSEPLCIKCSTRATISVCLC